MTKYYIYCRNCKQEWEDNRDNHPVVCGQCGKRTLNVGQDNILRFRVFCQGESTDGENISHLVEVSANTYEEGYDIAMQKYEDTYAVVYVCHL